MINGTVLGERQIIPSSRLKVINKTDYAKSTIQNTVTSSSLSPRLRVEDAGPPCWIFVTNIPCKYIFALSNRRKSHNQLSCLTLICSWNVKRGNIQKKFGCEAHSAVKVNYLFLLNYCYVNYYIKLVKYSQFLNIKSNFITSRQYFSSMI